MPRQFVPPIIGGIVGASVVGIAAYVLSNLGSEATPDDRLALAGLRTQMQSLSVVMQRIEDRLGAVTAPNPEPIEDIRPSRQDAIASPDDRLVALNEVVAELRERVTTLNSVLGMLRDSFGLPPLKVLARDLGPKWDAITAFEAEFGADARKGIQYAFLSPAEALARFGAPTMISAEEWSWARQETEIGSGPRSLTMTFQPNGQAKVIFRPQ